MTRTAPSGGFRIDTSGGANALAFDNIIFSDTVDEGLSMTDVVPLVESTPEALGSGSIVRVDDCEFRDFVNGTFFIGSFSSDASGDGCSTFDVRSSVFTNNTGVDLPLSQVSGDCCGGAINIDASANSTISIVASEFSSNNATLDGGAVRLIGGGSVSDGFSSVFIESTLFRMNSGRNAGALFVNGVNPTIRNSSFTANTASQEGGAVYVDDGETLDIRDSTFSNNTATSSGGAVFADELEEGFTCVRAAFIGNSAVTGFGGGVITGNVGPVNFTANDFLRNEAGEEGGAFRCEDTSGSNPVFTNVSNAIFDNTAPSFPNGFATGFSNTS